MYIVTFRIADRTVGGQTRQQRYNQLIENLQNGSDGFWCDTTSFFVIGSAEHTYEFAERISEGLSVDHDMLFTFDPEDMSACYFGTLESPEVLKSFFPLMKKLG